MATKKLQIIIAFGFLFCSVFAHAHPGGLDANGGHYNRKTGEYHYHNKLKQKDNSQPRKIRKKRKNRKQVTSCGKIVRVVDGDTFDIELGGIITRTRFRRGDAPELGTPEGEAAKINLVNEIEGKNVCITHNNTRGYYKRLLIDSYTLSSGIK